MPTIVWDGTPWATTYNFRPWILVRHWQMSQQGGAFGAPLIQRTQAMRFGGNHECGVAACFALIAKALWIMASHSDCGVDVSFGNGMNPGQRREVLWEWC